MDVSLVIPTFTRAELLEKTLPKLAEQITHGLEYEVVIVNNGSNDRTGEVMAGAMERYPGRFQYHFIPPSGGPSRPRNVGIRNARGSVVIVLDDDVVPEPDLVQKHWEFHQRYSTLEDAALGEVYVPKELKSDPMSLFHDFPYSEARKFESLGYLYFWTCNISVKREFMLSCGMFPEDMLYYEDIVCGHKLYSHGLRLRFLPEARGAHMHKLRPDSVAGKGHFIGKWLFALTLRIPDLAVKKRFGILTAQVGMISLSKRLLFRLAFRTVDTRFTNRALRLLGAERRKRDAITDLYYYLIFRRNMLAGYYQAKTEWKEESTGKALLREAS
jgi:glycosyltransferase involved in cell wall biosynthesis